MKLEDLITYCGMNCGSCARYQGLTVFREAIRLVAELVDSHGFQHWMPGAVKEFDYTEFRKALDFFGRERIHGLSVKAAEQAVVDHHSVSESAARNIR